MKHIFVGYGGKLRARWQEAFPDAIAITSVDALLPKNESDSRMVWLDISHTPESDRLPLVAHLVSDGSPFIVMSSIPNDNEAYDMLRHGAFGYCHNLAAPLQLIEIAHVVANGGLWVGQAVMRRIMDIANKVATSQSQQPLVKGVDQLTAKEYEVAKQVSFGASNKEIASALSVSERTVKAHLSVVFEKLDVRDRVQLALTMHNVKIH